jgi:hypothetical protein
MEEKREQEFAKLEEVFEKSVRAWEKIFSKEFETVSDEERFMIFGRYMCAAGYRFAQAK